MHFEILDSANNQFYFRIKASNGETLCHSETYTTKENAKHAIYLIKSNAANAEIKDMTKSRSVWQFDLNKK